MLQVPNRRDGDPEIERITARVAAYGLILHGLLHRLAEKNILGPEDLTEIENLAISVAHDLAGHSSTAAQVGGARIIDEIRQYLAVIR